MNGEVPLEGRRVSGEPDKANFWDSYIEEMQLSMSFDGIVHSINDSLRALLDKADRMDFADYSTIVESVIDSTAWENFLSTPEIYTTLLRLTIRRASSIDELDERELVLIRRVLEEEVPCSNLMTRYKTTIKSIIE